jgi:branched-chain amino acid transport system permease protein
VQFFVEVLISGLLAGIMYSLVALGYVLIYKASGVFNFAQGAMVFFAALTTVSIVEMNWFGSLAPNLAVAIVLTLGAMVLIGLATEKFVLRPLVNQPEITLFMVTIGLTFFLEGLAQLLWGAQPHNLDLGIQDTPIEWLMESTGILISQFEVVAALVAAALVIGLALFFSRTRIGRALRAVADDHQAALAVGIPLQQIWGIVWAVGGFVALVAGLLWGARNGVQFALTFITLKALPVLILGGFTSVPGAIVGGLIIGASEKLAEIYIPQFLNQPLTDAFGVPVNLAGLESWFPYMLALVFLLFRPEGLFGEKHIDRV